MEMFKSHVNPESNEQYRITVTEYSVSLKSENPIFGESVTKVSLDDEGAGWYIVLEQENGKIKLDFEEIGVIMEAINKLKNQWGN